MTKRATAIGVALCAAAGLTIGWGLDRGVSPDRAPGPGTTSKSASRGPRDLRPAPPGGVTARVRKIGAINGTGRRMKAAYKLALSVPVERIEEWLEGDYFDTPDSRVDTFFYRVLYERYLDADPEAFLTRCLRKNYETNVTDRYMKEWTRRDPAAARAFLDRQFDPKKFRIIAGAVIEQLARSDKAAALELITASEGRLGSSTSASDEGLKAIAEGDPDGLMRAAEGWSEPLQKRALSSAARAALDRDFLGGVAWIQEHAGPGALAVVRESTGSQNDFGSQLLEHAARLPDGWMKQILRYSTWSLTRKDPKKWLAVDAASLGVEPGDIRGLRSDALQHLVSDDWDEAAALLHRPADLSESERKYLVTELAEKLGVRDKDEAVAWMQSLGDPVLRETAQAELDKTNSSTSSRAVAPDPVEYVANAVTRKSSLNGHRPGTWTQAQTAEAIQAFTRLESTERTTAAKYLHQNAYHLPIELRGAALKHLIENPPDPESPENSPRGRKDYSGPIASLAQTWSLAKPAAASRWIESLPPGPERDRAAAVVLNTWRMESPREAKRWLGSLPEGGSWDGLRTESP